MYKKERHLKNLIDKNFERMLYPLDAAMSILFFPKYNIRDGFITPNSRFQKLKSFAFTVGLLFTIYLRVKTSVVLKILKSYNNLITVTIYYDAGYYSSMFVSFFIVHINHSTYYPNLVLKLQKALRNLRCVDPLLKQLMLWNWVSIVTIIIVYLALFLPEENSFAAFFNIIPLIFFDINIIFTIRVICMIDGELKLWIDEMHRTKDFQDFGRNQDVKEQGRKTFETYRYILDAFDLFKKVCQMPVIFEVAEILSHVIIYLQVNIDLKKQNPEQSVIDFITEYSRISISAWVSKNGFLFVMLCIACERFFLHVHQAENICKEALKSDIPEDVRRLCKNVCRCSGARDLRVRVHAGGAAVGARLPLRAASLIASYVAIVLQFDFL